MSRSGPYENFKDQPPTGWTTTDQALWMHPHLDGLDEYYETYYDDRGRLVPNTPVVSGGPGGVSVASRECASAVGAWAPDASDPHPPGRPLAPLISDVVGLGRLSRPSPNEAP